MGEAAVDGKISVLMGVYNAENVITNAVENCYKLMSNSKIMLTMVRTFFIRVKKEKVMKLINVLRGMETRQKCSSST